jgi:rubrerythrin
MQEAYMKNSLDVLNKILHGEHMAIEQYQAYIGELTDGPLRNHLTAILTDHKEHATRISYFIQTNGGHAEEGAGVAGIMINLKNRLVNMGEAVPMKILDRLYDAEDKGLARAKQYSEQFLSSAEKEVLVPIFSDELDHLKQLQSLREGLYVNL